MKPNIFLYEVKTAISYGLIRSMTSEELIESLDTSFLQDWEIRIKILERIKQLQSEQQVDAVQIEQVVKKFQEVETSLSTGKKQALDKTVARLVEMLPHDNQQPYVITFITSPRATRRKLGYRLATKYYKSEYEQPLFECFTHYQELDALMTFVRGSSNVEHRVDFLLENIDKLWAQAQVFEKLIYSNPHRALKLADTYPIQYAWGAARAKYRDAVPIIMQIVDAKLQNDDYEQLALLMWTLDKLEARQELIQLALLFDLGRNFTFLKRYNEEVLNDPNYHP